MLHSLRNWISLQKLRYDSASSWLNIVNFALLVALSSDKVAGALHIHKPCWFVPVLVSGAFFALWLVGFLLTDVVKIPQRYEVEAVSRSPVWRRLFDQLERIEKK